MENFIDNEKNFLSQYGNIVEYPILREDKIKEKFKQGHKVNPMYLIKVSQHCLCYLG